jgi:hypothetical protein
MLKGPAEPLRIHRSVEQGEVGGMEDRIAGARDHGDGSERNEGMRRRDQCEATPMVNNPPARIGRAPKRSTAKPAMVWVTPDTP